MEKSVSQNDNKSKPLKEVSGSLRRDNLDRVILAQLDLNFIRNKFDLLTEGLSMVVLIL